MSSTSGNNRFSGNLVLCSSSGGGRCGCGGTGLTQVVDLVKAVLVCGGVANSPLHGDGGDEQTEVGCCIPADWLTHLFGCGQNLIATIPPTVVVMWESPSDGPSSYSLV